MASLQIPQHPQRQQQYQQQAQPVQQVPVSQSVFDKIKMGAMMGTGVGLTIGFIGGSLQILRAGPGPKGALATLSQFMLTSAATFGFFMSIGTVIRTDTSTTHNLAGWRMAAQQPGGVRLLAMRPRDQAQHQREVRN